MNIKCDYCDSVFDESLEKCPNCGAPNANVKRSVTDQPKTIEELKEWYSARGLPPYETTRFFIGMDYKGPRAFGIYKDERSGKFIVYKNKDTGVRAVRYEGNDEAYAVNELFMRLKEEILQQKARNRGVRLESEEKEKEEAYNFFVNKNEHEEAKREFYNQYVDEINKRKIRAKKLIPCTMIIVAIAVIIITTILSTLKVKQDTYSASGNTYTTYNSSSSGGSSGFVGYGEKASQEGYYKLGDDYYYHNGNDKYSWFVYNKNKSDWDYVEWSDVPDSLTYADSESPCSYKPDWETESYLSDFSNTDAYKGTHHESSDYSYSSDYSHDSGKNSWWSGSDDSWSSDSSWDWGGSDSWDSGSTDWGSDW